MALFSSDVKAATVPELIARRKYRAALDLLREQLNKRPGDKVLRLQSADVMMMMGMIDHATLVLSAVADDFAAEGFAAKAIAVLKKIQRIEPERRDVERRIAEIFKRNPPPRAAVSSFVDFRNLNQEDVERDTVEVTAPPSSGFELPPSDELEIEIDMGLFEQPAIVHPGTPQRRVASPLFDEFAEDEMVEVIRGLELLAFEPGDIVVTEGQTGDSLYVVTTGIVKAFVRDREGGNTLVRRLGEGDFFGEISVLSGKPRTATITAATACELLRLDRAALDEITRRKPAVRSVLQRFHDERANSAAELEVRG